MITGKAAVKTINSLPYGLEAEKRGKRRDRAVASPVAVSYGFLAARGWSNVCRR